VVAEQKDERGGSWLNVVTSSLVLVADSSRRLYSSIHRLILHSPRNFELGNESREVEGQSGRSLLRAA